MSKHHVSKKVRTLRGHTAACQWLKLKYEQEVLLKG